MGDAVGVQCTQVTSRVTQFMYYQSKSHFQILSTKLSLFGVWVGFPFSLILFVGFMDRISLCSSEVEGGTGTSVFHLYFLQMMWFS